MTRAVRGDKGGAEVGGEAGKKRLEDVVRQRIGVFARESRCARPIVAAPRTPAQSTWSAAAGSSFCENCPRSIQAWTSAAARA
jgi:hypothetical protein